MRDLFIKRWDGFHDHSVDVEICPICRAVVRSDTEYGDDASVHAEWHNGEPVRIVNMVRSLT